MNGEITRNDEITTESLNIIKFDYLNLFIHKINLKMWTKTIQSVADQLCHPLGIKDYDVALMVAELYIQKRITDSTEESRKYHFDRLTLRMMQSEEHLSGNPTPCACCINPRSLTGARAVQGLCSCRNPRLYPFTYKNTLKSILGYITSEGGIRGAYWRVSASVWGVNNLNKDKDKLTLRDKLDDLKHIPLSVIKQGWWVKG